MQKYFTKQRLNSFSKHNNYDEYIRNIQIGMELLPLFHIFEITLRNKIDSYFVNYDANWLITRFNDNNLVRQSLSRIYKVRPKNPNDFILSNLTFGFWVTFFSESFIKKNRINLQTFTKCVLLNNKGKVNKAILKTAHQDFEKLRQCRNRVFHHENILNYKLFSPEEIKKILLKYLMLWQEDTTDLIDIYHRILDVEFPIIK